MAPRAESSKSSKTKVTRKPRGSKTPAVTAAKSARTAKKVLVATKGASKKSVAKSAAKATAKKRTARTAKSSTPAPKFTPVSVRVKTTAAANDEISIDKHKTVSRVKKVLQTPRIERLRQLIDFERVDPIIIQIARFTGMFFILAGGFFSFLSFETAGSTTPQHLTSSVISSTDGTGSTTTEITSDDSSLTTGDPEPDVIVQVQATSPVEGDAFISVTVSSAEEVKMLAAHHDTGHIYTLGRATLSGNDTWKLAWNTNEFDNGTYSLSFLIKNKYGTYSFNDTAVYEVFNEANETVTNSNSTIIDSSMLDGVTFPLDDKDVLASEVSITISAPDFDKVAIYAIAKTTRELIRLDLSKSDPASGTWTFFWDTRSVPNDEYQLKATVFIDQNTETIFGPSVIIRNAVFNDFEEQKAEPDASEDPTFSTATTSDKEVELTTATTTKQDTATEVNVSDASLEFRIPSGPLEEIVSFELRVKNAEFIELYYTSTQHSSTQFLGLAHKIDSEKWGYRLDTTRLPNGTYTFKARARTAVGPLNATSEQIKLYNEPVPITATENPLFTEIDKVVTDLDQKVIFVNESEVKKDDRSTDMLTSTVEKQSKILLLTFKEDLEEEIKIYTAAVRSQNEGQIQQSRDRLLRFRARVVASALSDTATRDMVNDIDAYLAEEFAKIETRITLVEAIVRERTTDAITLDSDGDGITDYDEVRIYQTNPFNADTDNDGFTDGAEILGGFNPNDPSPEAVVLYESPKEHGITREDILLVESIEAVQEEGNVEDGVPAQALIRGKALPNSFVTLYIFSTPIIVTVKAEPDGSWAYHFDKELEDGTHEIYIGITDNTGAVVAKSRPLSFVKEAQAFTPVDASSEVKVSPVAAPLNSGVNVLITLSVAIVTIGLLLLLLGLYMDRRRLSAPTFDESQAQA